MALVLLFVLPGVPCVYYGTEVGLSGGAEPACREAFPWGDPQEWPHDLRTLMASLAALRRHQPALRSAELTVEVLKGPEGDDQGLRLVRGAADADQLEVVINRGRREGLSVPPSPNVHVIWPPGIDECLLVVVEPQSALVLSPCGPQMDGMRLPLFLPD